VTGLANPALVYTVLWVMVLVLTDLRLTNQLLPLNAPTVALVAANILSFWIIYGIGMLARRRSPDLWSVRAGGLDLPVLRAFVNRCLAVWAIGSVFEIYASGGLPIIWLLAGDVTRDYRDFGVFSFHGFITGVYLFILCALVLLFLLERRGRDLLIIVGLFVWSLLLINRGALVWALLETLGVFLLVRRISATRIAAVGAGVLAALLLFGYVGDMRAGAGRHLLRDLTTERGRFLAEELPSGFLWVYLYVTSPVNNIVGGIDGLVPLYRPYHSVTNLLPTVIRSRVYTDVESKYALTLVNEAFNTSTWYVNFLADFGLRGAFIIVCVIQVVLVYFYQQARKGYVWGVLAYAALFQALALSIFSDTFTSLVTLAQVFIALAYARILAKTYVRAVTATGAGGAIPIPDGAPS
jgi:oligosaccharide repeat unit polymerase